MNGIFVVRQGLYRGSEFLYVDSLDSLDIEGLDETNFQEIEDYHDHFEVAEKFCFNGLETVLSHLIDEFSPDEIREILIKMQTLQLMRTL